MNKILSTFLAMVLCFSLLPAWASADGTPAVRIGWATADGSTVSQTYDEADPGAEYVLPTLEEAEARAGLELGEGTLDHWEIWEIPSRNSGGSFEWNRKDWGEGAGASDDEEAECETGRPGETIRPVTDVVLLPVFDESETTPSVGGSAAYKVNLPAHTENGSVTASPADAAEGRTVTVTPAPDEGFQTDSVIVTDKDGKPVEAGDNGDGTYSFTMPASAVDVAVTFVAAGPADSERFVDVPGDAWFCGPVYWAVDQGITDGTDDTHFSPDATCTRAQMVTFLWRSAGEPLPDSASIYFLDVDTEAYYYDAVLWAVDQGITEGTSDDTFSPGDTVTRGQAVTFLWRYAGEPETASDTNPFTDVTGEDYFCAPVMWAVEEKITDGTADTTFSPEDSCRRSQVVTFLYRLPQ